jgi:hypothetical protein
MSELVIWSGAIGGWLACAPGEIIWLDRRLLSGGRDATLHRPPRCPGLRHVQYRWELFSRDPSHPVFVAPYAAGTAPDHAAVQAAAKHVLPVARGGLEAAPVILDGGSWAVSVGSWVLPVSVSVTTDERARPAVPDGDGLPATYEIDRRVAMAALSRPLPDALPRVARYFQRNPGAAQAMAYYYQDFIRGAVAPQPRPLDSVVVALNLNKGAVSEYKKELQRRIWNEPGHQRELGEFLLGNGLIGPAELERALAAAAANEAAGKTRVAQERLRYNPR